MKRFLTLLFSVLLALSLIGCAATTSSTVPTKQETKTKITAIHKDSEDVSSQQNSQQKPVTPIVTKIESKTEPKKAAIAQPKKVEKPKTTTTLTKSAARPAATPVKQTTVTKPKPKPPVQKPVSTVTISIVGPKDHKNIVAAEKISFKEGDTIYNVLLNAAKKHGLQVDSRGSGATAYVEGIDNIYEFDYGVKSGWIFKQNGASLTRSIGVTKVKAGDQIQCFYTE